jgi:diaminopimelate epimerase
MRFVKLCGAGNDFILIKETDGKRTGLSAPSLAKRLCDRRKSIGADGLLILKQAARQAPRVDYYNSDGSSAFCGNGTRCAAHYLLLKSRPGAQVRLKTCAGEVLAHKTSSTRVEVELPSPCGLKFGLKIKIGRLSLSVHAVDTGSPHAVVFVKKLEDFPVAKIGPLLRRHPLFAPQGVNVNFASVRRGGLSLRTYERGVEAETLACGSGAVASAIVASSLGKTASPVVIKTAGGILRARFEKSTAGNFDHIRLEGPAQIIFKGEIAI